MQHRPWKKTGFQPTALIAVVVLLMILFSLVGYFFLLPDLERSQRAEQLLADIEVEWDRWRSTRPAAYRYVVQRECYCPDEITAPHTVTVPRVVQPDMVVDAIQIDELFEIATDATTAKNRVEVVFDPRFGYPTRVTIDDLEGTRASVETYRIRDFEVIDYARSDDTG